jgi:C_GCAxxG_C_C family probable redox protein
MSKDSEQVARLHRDGKLNCAQAMLSTYGKKFGLSEELAIKMASGFGGGMGQMGETCGAVTGAFMVLGGLVYEASNPNARSEVYSLIRDFTQRFISRNGSINCKTLLGYDFSTEEGTRIIRERKLVSTICPGLDQCAAEIVEELIAEKLPHLLNEGSCEM